ncbi:MAG: radical SAM protein [Acidobacteria bacterium]|nr:MAG: radical SAM protein [Acidobacteriota bacterium]
MHCYSFSGPKVTDELAPSLLIKALTDASRHGYGVASFSGGEPLMYKGLPDLLAHAHACGMLTTITTNGMLLDERRLEQLHGKVDLIAISLDGRPESHNRVRASPRAFSGMRSRLKHLRKSGIPFGFIFTLTQYNLDELDWVAAFAVKEGAQLLQIHPLENVGRAAEEMAGERPDQTEAAYAVIEALRLKDYIGERVHIQVDLIDRQYVENEPETFFAGELPGDSDNSPFAELISPLVIEPDGAVVPIQYGFARKFALGSLYEASLDELIKTWRGVKMLEFRALCRRLVDSQTGPAELPFFNWYELLGEMADNRASAAGTTN